MLFVAYIAQSPEIISNVPFARPFVQDRLSKTLCSRPFVQDESLLNVYGPGFIREG